MYDIFSVNGVVLFFEKFLISGIIKVTFLVSKQFFTIAHTFSLRRDQQIRVLVLIKILPILSTILVLFRFVKL